jgi:hypothetical protein
MGWSSLSNGQLLDVAEKQFDVLMTTDQALPTPQDLSSRKLAVLILPFASWPRLKRTQRKLSRASQRCGQASVHNSILNSDRPLGLGPLSLHRLEKATKA